MDDSKTRILVIEDDPANRELLVEYLTAEPGYEALEAADARSGFELLSSNGVDLVVLDVMLPDESGFNLCRRMKSVTRSFVPVIMVTALNGILDKVKGLEAGADDFITKPILKQELLARARSHLRTKRMVDRVDSYRAEIAQFNQRLQEQVTFRTRQLQSAMKELRRAKEDVEQTRLEIVDRLGIAAEYRDEETGQHIRRIGPYVHELALSCGLAREEAELYRLAAPLHDIGKMGVRDHVLLKPEQLEEGEAELIRQHTTIGAQILADPRTDLMVIAQQMARSHHERWDGRGYPDGLRGEEIPLPARICAVADVFDATTTQRVYRTRIMTSEEAKLVVCEGSGSKFDPAVVAAFERAFPALVRIGNLEQPWESRE